MITREETKQAMIDLALAQPGQRLVNVNYKMCVFSDAKGNVTIMENGPDETPSTAALDSRMARVERGAECFEAPGQKKGRADV